MLAFAHDQYRPRRVPGDLLGHTPENHVLESRGSMRGDDDQVRRQALGDVNAFLSAPNGRRTFGKFWEDNSTEGVAC